MKASELRIGNLVLDREGKSVRASIFDIQFLLHWEIINFSNEPPIKSIHLTDDVMKKTEFKTDPLFINKTNRIYSLGRLLIEVKQELRKAAIYFDGTLFCYIPANLHSLQNFYFATMGEELTIKH